MDYNRIILQEMLKKYKYNDNIEFRFNIKKALEFYKWLSYVPEFQQKYIDVIINKNVEDLTSSDLYKLRRFKIEKEMAIVFKRYISDNCNKEDILSVYDFMKTNSLDSLIRSKLTNEEYLEGNRLIKDFSLLSLNKLYEYINENEEMEKYLSLDIIESYVFHELDKIAAYRNNIVLNEKLSWEVKKNEFISTKSYQKAINSLK